MEIKLGGNPHSFHMKNHFRVVDDGLLEHFLGNRSRMNSLARVGSLGLAGLLWGRGIGGDAPRECIEFNAGGIIHNVEQYACQRASGD